jgi:ketoreductase RED2
MGAFDGQVAIVTGSSSGIGEAVARRFAAGGGQVVVNSSKSVEAGSAVAASLPGSIYVQADVSDQAQAEALVETTIATFGRLDVLVNNAGTTKVIPHADLDAATLEVWQRIFEVNVFGTWLVSRAAVPALRDTRGCIVNITSLAGSRPVGSSIPYASSKAALDHLTRLMAKVLGPEVRVNAVAPGLVDTPWTADWDAARAGVQRMAPLARSGKPDDIADAVLGLVHAKYATGQVLVVDGGLFLA